MKTQLIGLALAIGLLPAVALAQQPAVTTAKNPAQNVRSSRPNVTVRPRPYVRDMKQFAYERLKSPPDLPDMPPWPSAYKLVDAVVAPNSKGGPSYQVQFHSPDKPSQVLEYYSSTLPQYKWTIARKTEKILSANKGTSVCNVYVMAPSRPKVVCDVLVTYTQDSKSGLSR